MQRGDRIMIEACCVLFCCQPTTFKWRKLWFAFDQWILLLRLLLQLHHLATGKERNAAPSIAMSYDLNHRLRFFLCGSIAKMKMSVTIEAGSVCNQFSSMHCDLFYIHLLYFYSLIVNDQQQRQEYRKCFIESGWDLMVISWFNRSNSIKGLDNYWNY